jgi:dTDP-4-dehydrorhamnose reductase
MRVLLIGAGGQLGSDLAKVLSSEELIPLTHADIEVCDPVRVRGALQAHAPDVVINTAAFHRVDDCEREPERAFTVNAFAARDLALACRERGCALVHLSTDYVFDGCKGSAYDETDPAKPINAYGISKLAGEFFIRYNLDKHYIVRTSGLYGIAGSSGKGGNFVELMLRLAREGKDIKVVHDQTLTPTYTADLARAIARLIRTDRYGLYHITSSGGCSWYQFAARIFEAAGVTAKLEPTTTAAFGAAARRPTHSVLAHKALMAAGLDEMRPWPEALAAYLAERATK